MGKNSQKSNHVLLFDGVCLLCNKAVHFLILRDSKAIFCFAPLQGETAKKIQERQPDFLSEKKSIVLVEDYNTSQEKIYQKSDAIIRSLAALGGLWKTVKLLYFIPKKFRDWFYDYIARNRYNWFPPSSSNCLIPKASLSERFLN